MPSKELSPTQSCCIVEILPSIPHQRHKVKMYDSHLRRDNGTLYGYDQ